MDLSVVVPVYLGEPFVHDLVRLIGESLSRTSLEYEIILVDDRGPDDSWERIKEACARDGRVKGLRLSRNFGQHYAITAGLRTASGAHVAVMDCDLQDDPRFLPRLLEKAAEGYDIVYSYKRNRAHPFLKNLLSKAYARIFNWLTGHSEVRVDPNIGCYTILSRKVVDAFLSVQDYHRHYLLTLAWLGFGSTRLEIEHRRREKGKSGYTLRKLVALALNGITSQSTRLLYASIAVGFAFVAVAAVAAVAIVVGYFVHGYQAGWPSLVVTILMSTGVILLSLGINSIYLAKTYEQTKNRPLFIVDETLNLSPQRMIRTGRSGG